MSLSHRLSLSAVCSISGRQHVENQSETQRGVNTRPELGLWIDLVSAFMWRTDRQKTDMSTANETGWLTALTIIKSVCNSWVFKLIFGIHYELNILNIYFTKNITVTLVSEILLLLLAFAVLQKVEKPSPMCHFIIRRQNTHKGKQQKKKYDKMCIKYYYFFLII